MEILHEAPVHERKSFESPEQLLLTADAVGLLQVLVLFCNPAPQVDEQAVHADQYVHPISPAKEWHGVRYFGAFFYYSSFSICLFKDMFVLLYKYYDKAGDKLLDIVL